MKKLLGIKIYGVALIILSILSLLAFPICIAAYRKTQSIIQPLLHPEFSISTLVFFIILSILIIATVFVLFGFIVYLTAGIGVLKLKPWARHLVLLIAISRIVTLIWEAWFFGPQMHGILYYVLWALISVFTLQFFSRQNIKEQFSGIDSDKVNLIPKIFLTLVSIGIVLQVISMPLYAIYMIRKFQKLPVAANKKAEKVVYQVRNNEFLIKNFKRQKIFEYNIYLPKGAVINSVSALGDVSSWSISIVGKIEEKNVPYAMILNSKSLGEYGLFPIGKFFKFKSPYEFERAFYSPGWMQLYKVIKPWLIVANLERIEEGISDNWKGFLQIGHNTKGKSFFDCSLYDKKGESSAGIVLIFKNEAMTTNQARDILASLKFEPQQKDELEYFGQGKKDLSEEDYVNAAINFVNALYMDEQNLQYTYYLARSLFEDDNEMRQKNRLEDSKRFLEHALNLNPDYDEAKKLLDKVDKKIAEVTLPTPR